MPGSDLHPTPFSRHASCLPTAPGLRGGGGAMASHPQRSGLSPARWIAFLGLLLTLMQPGAAQAAPTEYQVKAAYLLNFVKYVEWPTNAFQEPTSPFVIGVLGHDPFGMDLDQTVTGRSVNNRPIVVQRMASHAEAGRCHVLFVSASEKSRFDKILGGLRASPVLTVSDADTFLDLGGVMEFVNHDQKIRFRANLNSARACQIKISSRLLSVAGGVVGKPEGGPP